MPVHVLPHRLRAPLTTAVGIVDRLVTVIHSPTLDTLHVRVQCGILVLLSLQRAVLCRLLDLHATPIIHRVRVHALAGCGVHRSEVADAHV